MNPPPNRNSRPKARKHPNPLKAGKRPNRPRKAERRLNPLKEDGTDGFIFNKKELYIVPTGVDAGMRPLKVVFEGDVFSNEATNIDDLSWEIRLDQYFNAAIAKGVRPYMSMYADSSI